MSSVRLNGIAKRFGSTEVLEQIDLAIESGEFIVFVGASGSGKSTLLRIVAGLEHPSEGEVFIGDTDVTNAPPAERGVSMVFQSYALYPHMSVRQNIGFGLKLAKTGKAAIAEVVDRVAEMLEIAPLLDRKPGQLSGGQRQRVAIARAIVREPQVFLFDEPLSNLDAALRTRTRMEIRSLHQKLAATMIYVTHDQVEAMSLADRMVILHGGRIEQVGPPAELYHCPATAYVAAFLGSPTMNFLSPQEAGVDAKGAEQIGIRPEDIAVADTGIAGTIDAVEELGETRILHVALDQGGSLLVRDRSLADPRAGQAVKLRFDEDAVHRFDAGGRRI